MRGLRCALAALVFGWGTAAAQAPLYVPPQGNTIIAVVESVDLLGKTVTVLDTWGIAREFSVASTARVGRERDSFEEFTTLADVKPGDRVKITYSGPVNAPGGVRLTILPRPSSGYSGMHPYPY